MNNKNNVNNNSAIVCDELFVRQAQSLWDFTTKNHNKLQSDRDCSVPI